MIEPVQVYARIPALLRGYAKVEQATAGLTALPDRVKALAELRAATLTSCEYCIDLGSQVVRRWSLTDAQHRPGHPHRRRAGWTVRPTGRTGAGLGSMSTTTAERISPPSSEGGTNRGRLRGQRLLIGCVGEIGVPAPVVVGEGVVEDAGADLQ